jgi:hypothetical protein
MADHDIKRAQRASTRGKPAGLDGGISHDTGNSEIGSNKLGDSGKVLVGDGHGFDIDESSNIPGIGEGIDRGLSHVIGNCDIVENNIFDSSSATTTSGVETAAPEHHCMGILGTPAVVAAFASRMGFGVPVSSVTRGSAEDGSFLDRLAGPPVGEANGRHFDQGNVDFNHRDGLAGPQLGEAICPAHQPGDRGHPLLVRSTSQASALPCRGLRPFGMSQS